MNSKIAIKEDSLSKSKEFIASMQKEIEDLNKKIEHMENSKNITLEFRHEKFNEIEKKINEILNNISEGDKQEKDHLISLWK